MEKKKTTKKSSKAKTTKVSAKKTTTTKVTAEKIVETKPKIEEPKKNNYGILKVLLLCLLVAAILSWIIPTGTLSSGELVTSARTRTGIYDLFLSTFYGANYYLINVMFLAAIGIFYGVIGKTKGYHKLVEWIAKGFSGKNKLFIIITSLSLAILTSMVTHPFVMLIFVPLIYSVAKELKIGKLSTFAMTFGALLVGLMGTTYGTYGVQYLTQSMNVTQMASVGVRWIVLLIAFLLINTHIIYNAKKDKEVAESITSEEVDAKSKSGKAKFIVIFAIILGVVILGYIAWSNVFGVTAFEEFHSWLTTVKFGNYPVIGYILGNLTALGTWDLFNMVILLLVIIFVIKFTEKITWNEVFDRSFTGLKAALKPMILITLAYTMFVICYWSGFTSTIIGWINSGASFNPVLNAIGNGLATVFHVDFGYSGFLLASFYATKFASFVNQIMTIMISMNGLVSFIAPTSVIMLVGLGSTKTSYKEWFKYIGKFVLAMFVILLIIFAIITYVH